MNTSLLERARKLLQARNRKNKWYRLISTLGVIVVFITSYMLILPAITMERTAYCGMQEHTHTAECYAANEGGGEAGSVCVLPEHIHTEDCYIETEAEKEEQNIFRSETNASEQPEEEMLVDNSGEAADSEAPVAAYTPASVQTMPEILACSEKTLGVHRHGEDCYDENHHLICRTADYILHTHDESCYDADGGLVCVLPEIKAHIHGADCYQNVDGVQTLICNADEWTVKSHQHTQECFAFAEDVTEDEKEEPVHTHTEECFPMNIAVIAETEASNNIEGSDLDAPDVEDSAIEGAQDQSETTVAQDETKTAADETDAQDETKAAADEAEAQDETKAAADEADVQDEMQAADDAIGMDEADGVDGALEVEDFAGMYNLGVEPLKLDSFITSVELGKLGVNNKIESTLTYQIHTSELKTAGTNILTYQWPDGLKIYKELDGKIMDGNNTVVGTWTASMDGTVTLIFNEDYAYSDTDAEITGTTDLWSRVDSDKADENHKVTVEFNDEIKKEIEISTVEVNKNDVLVRKKNTNIHPDQANGTVTFDYEVEVRSTLGTGAEINFKDQLEWANGEASYENVSIKKLDSNGNEVMGWASEGSLTNIGDIHAPGITGMLPALNAGERYVITYSVTKKLEANNDSVRVTNKAVAENDKVHDESSVTTQEKLFDLKVEKSSQSGASINKEAGTVTNTYLIKVSTEHGTKEDISLEDVLTISGDALTGANTSCVIASVKKGDGTPVGNALKWADGRIQGTLPKLNAGEYYEIEYTVTLSNLNLPDTEKVSFGMDNTVKAESGPSKDNDSHKEPIEWVGENYCDWIHKTGMYDPNSKKITWKITLNKNGYGNIHDKTLRDFLNINNTGETEQKVTISVVEKKYETQSDGSQKWICDYPPFEITLPHTFVNGENVSDETGGQRTINTRDEFVITYVTEVKDDDLTKFENIYKNKASIDDKSDETEVPVEKKVEIDKEFKGNEETTVDGQNGYKLWWNTMLEMPEDGLGKDSYYEDHLSDYGTHVSASINWFPREYFNDMKVIVGERELTEDVDYKLTVSGTERRTESWEVPVNDVPLAEWPDGEQYKIKSFKITLLQDIVSAQGDKMSIVYSSFIKGDADKIAYNEVTYHEGDLSVSGKAEGRGDTTNELLKKTNADGTRKSNKLLSAMYDPNLDKYVLVYRLLVNESHTAKGDITITDQLPEGTTFLVSDEWKAKTPKNVDIKYDLNSKSCLNGVYFRYYEYWREANAPDKNPYTDNERDNVGIGWDGVNAGLWNVGAKELGATVQVNGSSVEIFIPESAYSNFTLDDNKGEVKDLSLTMALYYAVSVDPAQMTKYENALTNNCTLTTTTGQTESSSVTDTIKVDKVRKSGEYDEDKKILSYSVDINSKGETILKGQSTDITIEDILTFPTERWCHGCQNYHKAVTQADIVPGSLELYRVDVDADGNEQEILANDVLKNLSLKKESGKMTLTAAVPDGVYYRLKYKYMLTFDEEFNCGEDFSISIKNTVKLNGSAEKEDSSTEEEVIETSGGSATANKEYTAVTLYKRDKANALHMLPGAEFVLERYNGSGWSTVYSDSENGTFTTDEDGMVRLGEKLNEDTYRIAYNCAYRLREVKAPDGYKLLADDMYFYVSKSNQIVSLVPEDWETNTEYTNHMLDVVTGGYLFVDNEKQEDGKTEIGVTKKWKDINGNKVDAPKDAKVRVILYRKTSVDQEYKEQKGEAYLSAENGWRHVWTGLEKYQWDGTPYYYYVEEDYQTDDWGTSYNPSGLVAGDSGDLGFEITNTKKDDSTSISVEKKWLAFDGSESQTAPEDAVTVKLKRKYQEISLDPNRTVTLNVNVKGRNASLYDDSAMPSEDHCERTIEDVPYGSIVTLTMDSSGFNKFANVASITPATAMNTSFESKCIDVQNDKWTEVESLSFTIYQNTTLNIGNEWSTYDYSTLKITYTTPSTSESNGGWIVDEDFEEEIVLSAANGWKYDWKTLAANRAPGVSYYYYIEETVPNGYQVTYTYENGQTATTSGNVVVTNRATSEKYTSVTVNKQWKSVTGELITNPTGKKLPKVMVQLYRSTTPPEDSAKLLNKAPEGSEPCGDPVEISSNTNWTHTWNMLEKYNDNNQPYYYYAVEVSAGDVAIGVNNAPEVVGNGSDGSSPITLTNREEATEISVEKVWRNNGNQEVTMELYSSTTNPQGGTPEPESEETRITVKVANWQFENGTTASAPNGGWIWTQLFACDEYGNPSNWSQPLANQNLQSEGWTAEYQSDAEAEYYCIQCGAGENDNLIKGIVNRNQSGIVTDGNGNAIVIPRGATRTLDLTAILKGNGGGTGGGNEGGDTPTGERKVTLQFKNLDNPWYQPSDLEQMISNDINEIWVKFTFWDGAKDYLDEMILTVPNGVSIEAVENEIDTSASRCYRIYRLLGLKTQGENCTLIFEFPGDKAYPDNASIISDNGVNTASTRTASRSAARSSYTADAPTGDVNNTLKLPDDKKLVGEVTLGSSKKDLPGYSNGGWKYTWSNLPKTDENGNTLYYYFKEQTTGAFTTEYTYQYIDGDSSKGISLVTVTNTPTVEPKYVDITVQKKWEGQYESANAYNDYVVKVQLMRQSKDGGNWEPVGLLVQLHKNQTPAWTYTWNDLPDGYIYKVEEVGVTVGGNEDLPVNGFTTAYSDNQAGITEGTITITNTSKFEGFELPETGGTGTLPYTLGGLLLSVSAIFLMYKEKRRKEVGGSP